MWRKLRIVILLLILAFVALNTYFDRVYSTDWNIPLAGRAVSDQWRRTGTAERFVRAAARHRISSPVESFFEEEAHAIRRDHGAADTFAARAAVA